jgi:porin
MRILLFGFCLKSKRSISVKRILLSIVVLLSIAGFCKAAEQAEEEKKCDSIMERDTLTNGFFGLNDRLANSGLELRLSATQIYQQNTKGGISTHRKAGRFTGSYDLELSADLQKLLGIEGGRFYILTESSFSNGINGPSVGSFFGVNGDGEGNRSIDITQMWYEQSAFDDNLRVRVGKLDLTGGFDHYGCPVAFDCSMYANNENSQFLNSALINNPTIPFPDRGLGVMAYYHPMGSLYLSAGAADADADARETGFNTTFDGDSDFFYIFETGITPKIDSAKGPLQGAYRIGMWVDGKDKQKFSNGEEVRNDTGFYTTFDQMVWKENAGPNDSQGLGAFFKYGWASGKVDDVTDFWSIGLQYQGLFESRDDDVLAFGMAQGVFTEQANANDGNGYSSDNEIVFETYYNIAVTPWLHISPDVQYIANPGGDKSVNDAVVVGVRVQMVF